MNVIKKTVKSLLESQKSIAELNKTIREKRKKLAESKATTQQFLEENDLLMLDVGSHELTLKERTTAATLNKEFLGQAVAAFLEEKGVDNEQNQLSLELVEFVWKLRAEKASKKMFLSVKKSKVKKPKKRKREEESPPEEEPAPVVQVEEVEEVAAVEHL